MTDALRRSARELAGRNGEPTAAVTGSQSVRTAESGGPSGCDAGKRIKGRKRHIAVDTEGNPLVIRIHEASAQERNGAPEVIRELLSQAPEVRKIWANGGYSGPELAGKLKRLKLANHIEIVGKPKDIKGFTVLRRRWVVERTFAWMSRCRWLSEDHERSLGSSQAWVQLAACRFLMRRNTGELSA